MKHLPLPRIKEIAKEHGQKPTQVKHLMGFLSRIATTPVSEVPLIWKQFTEDKQTNKREIMAAEIAIEEMGGTIKKPKKKKVRAKKETTDGAPKKKSTAGKSNTKSTKAKSTRVSNYNYPEDATGDDKKKFRAKARAEANKWAKLYADNEVSSAQNKEYQAFLKKTYTT